MRVAATQLRLPASPAAESSARAARTLGGARRHPALARHRVPSRERVRTVDHARYLFGCSPLWSGYQQRIWLAVTSSDPLCGSLPVQPRDGSAGGACGLARRRHCGELAGPVRLVSTDACVLSVQCSRHRCFFPAHLSASADLIRS